jgi:DNA invertase Pin-like site-specific DNA recombinase
MAEKDRLRPWWGAAPKWPANGHPGRQNPTTFLARHGSRRKCFRAGLYARVSTDDQQTLAMQNRAMHEYAARRNRTVALQVREVNSGAALDLTTRAGRAMAGLLAIDAEFERKILRERTRAGLAQARENGKRLGRPT